MTTSDVVVITDIGSTDPDDLFTVLLALTSNLNLKAVIASHHYAKQRAKMVKLVLSEFGRSDIKVYVGNGVEHRLDGKYSDAEKAKFHLENSQFPALFGDPTQNTWFPDFAKSYHEYYSKDYIDTMIIESQSTKEFLNELLTKYDENNKLIIVCIAPPHDLLYIDTRLYCNMDLYVMGGGFEDIKVIHDMKPNEQYHIAKVGYNFGICPIIVDELLQKLNKSGQRMTLISSELVGRNDIAITLDTYDTWMSHFESGKIVDKITRSILQDWLYSNKGNKLKTHKNLCDPLTFILAESKKYESERFQMSTNHDVNCDNYLKSINMLTIEKSDYGNINLVTYITDNLTNHHIQARLEQILFN